MSQSKIRIVHLHTYICLRNYLIKKAERQFMSDNNVMTTLKNLYNFINISPINSIKKKKNTNVIMLGCHD